MYLYLAFWVELYSTSVPMLAPALAYPLRTFHPAATRRQPWTGQSRSGWLGAWGMVDGQSCFKDMLSVVVVFCSMFLMHDRCWLKHVYDVKQCPVFSICTYEMTSLPIKLMHNIRGNVGTQPDRSLTLYRL